MSLQNDFFQQVTTISYGGNPADTGSAISSSGTLAATGCSFQENTAVAVSAGVTATGSVALDQCLFEDNTTTGDGSAVQLNAPAGVASSITNCTFLGNNGPTLHTINLTGGSLTISGSNFDGTAAAEIAGHPILVNDTFETTIANPTPLNFVVTDTSSSATDTGSLPYAIDMADAANADSTITFSATAFPAGSLAMISPASLPALTNTAHTVTIQGPGASTLALKLPFVTYTFPGFSEDPIFYVDSGVTAEISGLAIDDSATTVDNQGSLTLSNLSFNNDSADSTNGAKGGCVINGGTLVANGCSFQGSNALESGGAIYSTGTLTLNGDYFDDETALQGGAVYANGAFTVSDCTFQDCSSGDGGAIYDDTPTGSISGSIFNDDDNPPVSDATYATYALYVNNGDILTLSGNTFDGSTTASVGGSGTVGTTDGHRVGADVNYHQQLIATNNHRGSAAPRDGNSRSGRPRRRLVQGETDDSDPRRTDRLRRDDRHYRPARRHDHPRGRGQHNVAGQSTPGHPFTRQHHDGVVPPRCHRDRFQQSDGGRSRRRAGFRRGAGVVGH